MTTAVVGNMVDICMNALRIPITNTTERNKVQNQMSLVYGDICAKQDWWWLEGGYETYVNEKWDTGTIAVSQGSTSATLSTAPTGAISTSLSERDLLITNNADEPGTLYYIQTQVSTTITFTVAYTGATDTAATFAAYHTRIGLSGDIGKVIRVITWGLQSPLKMISQADMEYLRSHDQREGRPEFYSVYVPTFRGILPNLNTKTLVIHPFPDKVYRLQLTVKYAPDNIDDSESNILGSTLMLPAQFQQVLVYGTLSRCFPLFHNDLEKGAFYTSLFNDVIALMAAEQREYSHDRPSMDPSMGMYRNTVSRRKGRRSLGSWFDRLPAEF